MTGTTTLVALLAQHIKHCHLLAAGGIMNGQQVVAALAAGGPNAVHCAADHVAVDAVVPGMCMSPDLLVNIRQPSSNSSYDLASRCIIGDEPWQAHFQC